MAKIKNYLVSAILATGLITTAVGAHSMTNPTNEIQTTIRSSESTRALPEIVIWSPWYATGVQGVALANIVEYWNTNLSAENGFTVKVETIDGGYSALTSRVESDVNAGEAGLTDLPNIYINYADTTSVLLESGDENYALDLTDTTKVGTGNEIDPELFVEGSLTNSDLLAGAEEGAIYSIPMAMSSELMGINVPLFTWMLQGYVSAGGTVEISGEVADGISGKLGGDILTAEINPEDLATIEQNWKIEGTTTGTLTITDETFESAKSLTAMATELLTVVKDTNKDVSRDTSQGVIGIDASANEFYTYGQQITQSLTNPEDGLLSIDEKGNVSYNMIEEGTAGKDAAEEIWNFFIDGFESGALWNPNGDYSYGSNQFNAHKLAFSIGSTAGATYYVSKSVEASGDDKGTIGLVNPEDIYYTHAPGKFDEESTDAPVRMKQGPSFGAVDKGTEADTQTAIFLNWLVTGETPSASKIGGTTYSTPAEYMSVESGYIVGTKQVLADDSAFSSAVANGQDTTTNSDGFEEFVSAGTIGASIAKENFTDPEVELEQEPYGIHTSAFRKLITDNVAEAHDDVTKGKTPATADEFITELHNEAVSEGWMSGELWGQEDGMPTWAIILIIIASLTVVGLIAFLVYWFVFKNKNTL